MKSITSSFVVLFSVLALDLTSSKAQPLEELLPGRWQVDGHASGALSDDSELGDALDEIRMLMEFRRDGTMSVTSRAPDGNKSGTWTADNARNALEVSTQPETLTVIVITNDSIVIRVEDEAGLFLMRRVKPKD